jgi:hypothetical protein
MTPLSPVSNAEPDLQVLLEQVQEFLGIERLAATPIPVADPSPVPAHQVTSQVKTHARRGSLHQKFRDKFKRLLTKFNRASRGPTTLSSGLVPEREENAEITGRRYLRLFG